MSESAKKEIKKSEGKGPAAKAPESKEEPQAKNFTEFIRKHQRGRGTK